MKRQGYNSHIASKGDVKHFTRKLRYSALKMVGQTVCMQMVNYSIRNCDLAAARATPNDPCLLLQCTESYQSKIDFITGVMKFILCISKVHIRLVVGNDLRSRRARAGKWVKGSIVNAVISTSGIKFDIK